jgi:hypothetical protein
LLFQLLPKAVRAPARTAFFASFETDWRQLHAPAVRHICGGKTFKNLAAFWALSIR